MKPIQFKAQIKELDLLCEQHKLDFKAIVMTSRQVGDMDKMIKENKDEFVQMTIEAENKDLEIELVVSNIILEDFKCKAQQLKFTSFKCPTDKILIMNEYIRSKANVLVTIEQLQGKIGQESEPSLLDEDTHHEEHEDDFETDNPDELLDIKLKIPPKWNANCYIKIGKDGSCWKYGYILKVGNMESSEPFDESVCYDDLSDCTYNLIQQLNNFITAQKNFRHKAALKKLILTAVEEFEKKNS